jgi:hypothetical protein
LRRGVGIFKRFNDSAFCAPRRAYTVTPSQYVVLNTNFNLINLYLVTLYTLCSYFLLICDGLTLLLIQMLEELVCLVMEFELG